MNPEDLDKIDIKEELEFNDGVGDILTQKEQYKFSWRKTVIVSSIGLIGVIMLTFGILEIGKAIISIDKPPVVKEAVEEKPLDVIMKEVNNDTWSALPEDESQITAQKKSDANIGVKQNKLNSAVATEVKPEKIKLKAVVKKPVSKVKKPAQVTVPKVKSNVTSKKVIYRVIAGSFSNYKNATKELNRLKALGFDGYVWSLTSSSNRVSYKVQVGAFSSQKSAQVLVRNLKKKNISSFISKH